MFTWNFTIKVVLCYSEYVQVRPGTGLTPLGWQHPVKLILGEVELLQKRELRFIGPSDWQSRVYGVVAQTNVDEGSEIVSQGWRKSPCSKEFQPVKSETLSEAGQTLNSHRQRRDEITD